MKGRLYVVKIGIGVLMLLGAIAIKKAREKNRKTQMEIVDLDQMLKEKEEEAQKLKEEICDYQDKIDRQIAETEEMILRLKEDYGIDPREIDIQLDTV